MDHHSCRGRWSSIAFLACLLLGPPAYGQDLPPIDVSRPEASLSELQLLEDPTGDQSLSEVLDAPGWTRARHLNRGYSRSAWWFQVELTTDRPVRRLLEITNAYLDHVDVWILDHTGSVLVHAAVGDRRPFVDRPMAVPGFVVPMDLEPGRHRLVVRESTEGTIDLHARVVSPATYNASVWQRQVGWGVFYGILGMLLAQSVFLGFLLRERIYLAFGVYLGGTALQHAQVTGIADAVLYPNHPDWSASQVAVVCTAAAGIGVFTLDFNKVDRRSRVGRIGRLVIYTFVAVALLSAVVPYRQVAVATNGLVVVGILACLGVGLDAMRRREPLAVWFLAGWLPLLAGSFIEVGTNVGLLPDADLRFVVKVWALVQACIFSVALGLKVRFLRRKEEEAQRRALDAKSEAAARLEGLVEERTAQLETAMKQLVGTAQLREQVEAMLLHDLKSPLGSMFMVPTALDAMGPLTPAQDAVLLQLDNASHRMLEMVNRSHDLFRIESGTYRLDPSAFDLQALLHDLCAEIGRQTPNVEIVVDAPFTPPPVLGEPMLAYGALQNLVLNAAQATQTAGQVVIRPRIDNDELCIEITNPAEVPVAIRDTFFERGATAGKPGGSGLGTYIARRLAEIQGGRVQLDTSEPKQTTIRLWLPRAPTNSPDPSSSHWAQTPRGYDSTTPDPLKQQ